MRLVTSVLCMLLLTSIGCNVLPDAPREEKEKIQQITNDWIKALNNGEAERVASFYDEDATYATNNGLLLKGKKQIHEAFKQWLQTPQKVVSDSSFVAFNTDGNLAYTLNYYDHHIYPPEADSFVNKGYSLTVYERQEDGSWKIDALTINKHPDTQKPADE